MIELRWLERKTGKKLMNEWGFYYDETKNVLQYREHKNVTNYSVTTGNDFLKENVWTTWQDVPIVQE